ncbi:hypothetical protein Ahy_A03g012087 [Arachis hypogaea]|uniref:PB1-like domain-containing protein n=1 Tax=Arachis hypogaea TaxID=3818 RepID=A0A445DSH7_ARAHY|nr:hypothetical protein Ahy_A03g012087 [Arachis hypogaea]
MLCDLGAKKKENEGWGVNVIYDGGLVTEIHRVNVETCNLFFVEGLFLDLSYPGYNEVYWLEPGLDLGKGLIVLRTDAEVMRMCESAMKNDNTVHLYFDHPIDVNPEIIDKEVMSDGSSDSVVEVNPGGDNVNEVNEKENEGVNETRAEVNELNMALSVVVKETVNEVVNEATVDLNESNKGESGAGEEAANDGNEEKGTEGALAPQMGVKKVRKRHPRPPPRGLSRERRAAENEVPESDPREGKAEAVNEPTYETNADDVNDPNEGSDFGEPVVDELRSEEPVTENPTDNVTQTTGRTNTRRNHPRPQPSGQRIILGKEDQAPRVEVPNPNREDGESEPEMYQYESKELCSPPASDDEEEPVFPQHNPNTPYGKITLELNMEFETMDHFKATVQKYNIQIERQVFYLRNEKKRCRVICYDPDCPWLCYCARTNYPASFQIKTFVDKHMCPRSNKSKSISCSWVAEEMRPIGRPIKKRRKDSTEQSFGNQYKAKRRYGQITCQICKRMDIIAELVLRKELDEELKNQILMRKKLGSKKLTGRRPWRLHMLHMLQMRKTSLKIIHKVSLIRMISAISWILIGALKAEPTIAEPPSKEEIQDIITTAAASTADIENEEEAGDERMDDAGGAVDEVARALNVADALGKADKLDDIALGLKELDMEHYDDEDEGVEVFSSGIGDLYYPSSDLDPYIKDKNDDDDSEELEDMLINPTDSIIICARTEDYLSLLEMRKTSLKTIHKVSLITLTHSGNTTTNATPPNVATIPAPTNLAPPTTTSQPAPTPKRRDIPSFVRGNLVPPRGRGSTTPRQNAAAAPSPPAQPRVVRLDLGSSSQIPTSPSNAANPCSGTGSMPHGPLVRPNLQAQRAAPFRPPTVTRETMAAAGPATQRRFTGFVPTLLLKKKKPSGPPPSKPSTNDNN